MVACTLGVKTTRLEDTYCVIILLVKQLAVCTFCCMLSYVKDIESAVPETWTFSVGYYFDYGAVNMLLESNTVYGLCSRFSNLSNCKECPYGVFVQYDDNNITISKNIIYNNYRGIYFATNHLRGFLFI